MMKSGPPGISNRSRRSRALAAGLLAFATCWSAGARAGGGSFGPDEDEAEDTGNPFLGFVRDRDGTAIPDAKVTIGLKSASSVTIIRTDSQGHYFVKGFNKDVDPNNVEVACSKDGYAAFAQSRRPPAGAHGPVEVDCVLEKK